VEPLTRSEIEACMRTLGLDELQARWHLQQHRALVAAAEALSRARAAACAAKYHATEDEQ
jgi:hypothetical protein